MYKCYACRKMVINPGISESLPFKPLFIRKIDASTDMVLKAT